MSMEVIWQTRRLLDEAQAQVSQHLSHLQQPLASYRSRPSIQRPSCQAYPLQL